MNLNDCAGFLALASPLYFSSCTRWADVSVHHPARGCEFMMSDFFRICCDHRLEAADQRRGIIRALKSGADIHATDKNGVTALHHAVRFRSPITVQTLIEHGANVNQACRRNGSTPLHRAVARTGAPGTAGKTRAAKEIVELLLAAGADPSIANKSGRTPLQYVRDEKVKVLLDAED